LPRHDPGSEARYAMLGLMMDRPLLISQIIDFAARFHPDVEIVSRSVGGSVHRTTYGEVARRSRRVARVLSELGVASSSRVATIAWNTHRHLELYFGVSGMGCVLHTINPRLSPEQLDYVVQHAEDDVLLFDRTFAPLARRLMERTHGVRHFIVLGGSDDADSDDPEGLLYYEDLVGSAPEDFEWPLLDERTASSLCYTSGTTGAPKGVLYSHRSTVLHSYSATMADSLGISARDVTLPVVPMFHVNAWGVPYAAAMVGSKLVLPGPRLDAPALLEQIRDERVTSLLGVPTVWLDLLAEADRRSVRLDSVQKVVVGGSAAPPSLIEAFERDHDVRVLHAWGMTETSPLGTVNRPLPRHDARSARDRIELQTKQGRPLFGVDLRIVDDDGHELPHDGATSGHLQIRGPWVASTYFKEEASTAHRDGWFHTGDIANIDAEGFVLITDRSKDVIKSGGEWISSIELEGVAMMHPDVGQAAVIGVRHPKWQERPLLIVVPRADRTLDPDELRAFIAERVPRFWLPDAIEVIDALPVGATGKVLKRELRARFAEYTATDEGRAE